MNIKAKLSARVGLIGIQEITLLTQSNNKGKQALYDLLFDVDDMVAYQATWVFTHFSRNDNEWLYDKQNELIDEVLVCLHPGKRRLLLTLLLKQPLSNPPRTDFLNFCLEKMISKRELPGVRTLCLKLSYEMCCQIPELMHELCMMLDMMEHNLLEASMRAAHKNVLKKLKSRKKAINQ